MESCRTRIYGCFPFIKAAKTTFLCTVVFIIIAIAAFCFIIQVFNHPFLTTNFYNVVAISIPRIGNMIFISVFEMGRAGVAI